MPNNEREKVLGLSAANFLSVCARDKSTFFLQNERQSYLHVKH